MNSHFDGAAFHAMKGVEVSVRDAASLGPELIGVDLKRAAFSLESGPLTDMEGGERVGRIELFAGAVASYKNPHSHRDVNLDDPYEALKSSSLRIIFCGSWMQALTHRGMPTHERGHPYISKNSARSAARP
jgi:hypothetical protein